MPRRPRLLSDRPDPLHGIKQPPRQVLADEHVGHEHLGSEALLELFDAFEAAARVEVEPPKAAPMGVSDQVCQQQIDGSELGMETARSAVPINDMLVVVEADRTSDGAL